VGLPGDIGPTGPPGAPGAGTEKQLLDLVRRVEGFERLLQHPVWFRARQAVPGGDTRLLGIISCPACNRLYDLQANCRVGISSSATVVCECGCQMEVNLQGIAARG